MIQKARCYKSLQEKDSLSQYAQRMNSLILTVLCLSFLSGCQPPSSESHVEEEQTTLVLVKIPGNGGTAKELRNRYVEQVNQILQVTDTGKLEGRAGALISADGTVDYIELRISSKNPQLLYSALETELPKRGAPPGIVAEWNGRRVRFNVVEGPQ